MTFFSNNAPVTDSLLGSGLTLGSVFDSSSAADIPPVVIRIDKTTPSGRSWLLANSSPTSQDPRAQRLLSAIEIGMPFRYVSWSKGISDDAGPTFISVPTITGLESKQIYAGGSSRTTELTVTLMPDIAYPEPKPKAGVIQRGQGQAAPLQDIGGQSAYDRSDSLLTMGSFLKKLALPFYGRDELRYSPPVVLVTTPDGIFDGDSTLRVIVSGVSITWGPDYTIVGGLAKPLRADATLTLTSVSTKFDGRRLYHGG